MNFLFILITGVLFHEYSCFEAKNDNLDWPLTPLFQSPLKNRFSFAYFASDQDESKLTKRKKAMIAFLEEWIREDEERIKREIEEKIYRQYLANRVKSSILRDFTTLRY